MRFLLISLSYLASACGPGLQIGSSSGAGGSTYRGFGNAASFTGTDDLSQSFPGPAGSSMTLEAWIQPSIAPATADRAVGINFTGGGLFAIAMAGSGLGVRVIFPSTCAATLFFDGSTVMAVGNRYHVAIVQDTGGATLYVNGAFDQTVATPFPTGCTTMTIRVGSGGGGQYFQGTVDDVRVSSVARVSSGSTTFPVPTDSYLSDGATLFLSGLESSSGWTPAGSPTFGPSPFP